MLHQRASEGKSFNTISSSLYPITSPLRFQYIPIKIPITCQNPNHVPLHSHEIPIVISIPDTTHVLLVIAQITIGRAPFNRCGLDGGWEGWPLWCTMRTSSQNRKITHDLGPKNMGQDIVKIHQVGHESTQISMNYGMYHDYHGKIITLMEANQPTIGMGV